MSYPNVINGAPPQQWTNTATKGAPIGTRMQFADGRRYVFSLCGATTLISGDLLEGKALVSADYTDLVCDVAPAIGDTSVTITTGASTAANYYDGGWMHVNLATTLLDGQSYRLKAEDANILWTTGAGDVANLEPTDPIRVAGTTATEVGFAPNEYNGVIVATQTTLVSRACGVAQAPITTAQYGFVQVRGMSCINSVTTSVVVGNKVDAILAAAGRIGVADAANIDAEIGIIMSVPTTAGQHASIFLTIE